MTELRNFPIKEETTLPQIFLVSLQKWSSSSWAAFSFFFSFTVDLVL